MAISPDSMGGTATFTPVTTGTLDLNGGGGGGIDDATHAITIPGNPLLNGETVVYQAIGNTAIGGLINGGTYYANVLDGNNGDDFQLSNQPPILLTPASTASATLQTLSTTRSEMFVLDDIAEPIRLPFRGPGSATATRSFTTTTATRRSPA